MIIMLLVLEIHIIFKSLIKLGYGQLGEVGIKYPRKIMLIFEQGHLFPSLVQLMVLRINGTVKHNHHTKKYWLNLLSFFAFYFPIDFRLSSSGTRRLFNTDRNSCFLKAKWRPPCSKCDFIQHVQLKVEY